MALLLNKVGLIWDGFVYNQGLLIYIAGKNYLFLRSGRTNVGFTTILQYVLVIYGSVLFISCRAFLLSFGIKS